MTISFVLIGVAAIPLGISVPFLFKLAKGEGIGREGELIPLVIAAVLLIVGVGIFISARMRSKMAERPTIKDEEEAGAQG